MGIMLFSRQSLLRTRRTLSLVVVVAAGVVAAGCPEDPAGGGAGPGSGATPTQPETSDIASEIAALDETVDGAELLRVAERAASEGSDADQREAVRRISEIAREMDTPVYLERLRVQAEEALRASGEQPSAGRVQQTVLHNRRRRYGEVIRAYGALAGERIEAVGKLLTIAEGRWESELRVAALDELEGHVPDSLRDRLLALASARSVSIPVRAAALARVAEIGDAEALPHLWPLVESSTPPLRMGAAQAALASGGADVVAELFEHLPDDGDYPPDDVDALAARLASTEPAASVTRQVLSQLESPAWPHRVIALRFLLRTRSPDGAALARRLRRDPAVLQPAEAWAAQGELRTVGNLAERVAEALDRAQ